MDTPVNESGLGALEVSLHPLVLINISDHHTRLKAQHGTTAPRPIGALLGTQEGRQVEIFTSFECLHKEDDNGQAIIDLEFIHSRLEQFKKVFPEYDMLGWYATGEEVAPNDMELHKTMSEINESPLFLLADTSGGKADLKDLPIQVFESELHIVDNTPTNLFVKTAYKIDTLEAERIAVDHVAKVAPTVTAPLNSVLSAVKMLNERVAILKNFLISQKNGPIDHAACRQIAALCNKLPSLQTSEFSSDFSTEYNDVLLTTYLTYVTNGTAAMNEAVDKFGVVQSQSRKPVLL